MNAKELRKLLNTKCTHFEILLAEKEMLGKDDSAAIVNNSNNLLIAAIDTLITASLKMSRYKNEQNAADEELYNEIADFSKEEFDQLAEEVYYTGPVSILRYVIAKKFAKGEIKSVWNMQRTIALLQRSFEDKQLEVFAPYLERHPEAILEIEKYEKLDPFRVWKAPYRILFPFVYDNKLKNTIWRCIEILRDNLLNDLGLSDWESRNSQGWRGQVRSYFGFEGPSNFGSQRAVLMLHPKNIPDHKNSIQLVCYFEKDTVSFGLDAGVNVGGLQHSFALNGWEFIDSKNINYLNEPSPDHSTRILQFYLKLRSYLQENLGRARLWNKELVAKNPAIGSSVIVEGDAELDDDGVNLFDTVIASGNNGGNNGGNGAGAGSGDSPEPLGDSDFNDKTAGTMQAKAVGRTSESKIYPNIKPDEDFLERDKIAEYLADFVIKNKGVEPLNIGIYGDWGSGKSQLINLIKKCLSSKEPSKYNIEYCDVKTVDFDAWQYNDHEHIWAALIMEILEKCKEQPNFYYDFMAYKIKEFFKNNWKELFLRLAIISWVFLFTLLLAPLFMKDANGFFIVYQNVLNLNMLQRGALFVILTLFPELFKPKTINIDKVFTNYLKMPIYSEQLGFRNEIKRIICYALEYLSNGSGRLVLFIDNLDRCASKNIKQILDSICQFLEICSKEKSRLIVIFAVDKNIIKDALKEEGVPEGKICDYLDKIIQMPIHLSAPDDIGKLIDRLYGEEPNTTKENLKQIFAKKKFIPRKLANLRYVADINRQVYDISLEIKEMEKYLY